MGELQIASLVLKLKYTTDGFYESNIRIFFIFLVILKKKTCKKSSINNNNKLVQSTMTWVFPYKVTSSDDWKEVIGKFKVTKKLASLRSLQNVLIIFFKAFVCMLSQMVCET